ncbi:MAG: 50S ribosomal protein L35ae [Candidatus Aenigmatarchaeota archaeon]
MAEKKSAVTEKKEIVEEKEAMILSFRRGRHNQKTNQFLLEIAGIDSKGKAAQFIGKRVVWKNKNTAKEKEIYGKITHTHGNSGVLRARFTKGLPGTAKGNKVQIYK